MYDVSVSVVGNFSTLSFSRTPSRTLYCLYSLLYPSTLATICGFRPRCSSNSSKKRSRAADSSGTRFKIMFLYPLVDAILPSTSGEIAEPSMGPRTRIVGKLLLYDGVLAGALFFLGIGLGRRTVSAPSDSLQRVLGPHGFVFGLILPLTVYILIGGVIALAVALWRDRKDVDRTAAGRN